MIQEPKPSVGNMQVGFTAMTNQGPMETWGYRVVFLGYEAFEFVAHRDVSHPSRWRVAEVSTGFAIGARQLTRQAAIEMATQVLQEKTPDELRGMIADALKIRTFGERK